jgi:CRP-like cAMP-binding protein
MGSSAVTERKRISDAQRHRLLLRIAAAQGKVDAHLSAADEWKSKRFELVEHAKAGGVTNKDIADALGMTIPGVVKLIERGRANGSE